MYVVVTTVFSVSGNSWADIRLEITESMLRLDDGNAGASDDGNGSDVGSSVCCAIMLDISAAKELSAAESSDVLFEKS